MTDTTEVRVIDDAGAGEREFLPGAGRASLMWSYDLMTTLAGIGKPLDHLVTLAGITPGQRVLDVGCGTGNLALRAAGAGGVVTGLDPDRGALERAARKARRRRLGLTLVRGYADHLPADDASVDHVVSSFALHHVPTEQKAAMAAEMVRVLRPGGTVTIVDFAVDGEHEHGASDHDHDQQQHGAFRGLFRLGGWRARRTSEAGYVADNRDHGIEHLLSGAGLTGAGEVETRRVHGLPIAYVQARRA